MSHKAAGSLRKCRLCGQFMRWSRYFYLCQRRGVVQEIDQHNVARGPQWWCRQHAPSAVAARDKARKEKWQSKQDHEASSTRRLWACRSLMAWAVTHRNQLPAEALELVHRFESKS